MVADVPPSNPNAPLSKAETRRSRRVLLVVPVEVSWVKGDGKKAEAPAKTEVVSEHGALVRVKVSLPLGTKVELRHPVTGRTTRARVVYLEEAKGESPPGIGLELESPSKEFWGITMPPSRGQR